MMMMVMGPQIPQTTDTLSIHPRGMEGQGRVVLTRLLGVSSHDTTQTCSMRFRVCIGSNTIRTKHSILVPVVTNKHKNMFRQLMKRSSRLQSIMLHITAVAVVARVHYTMHMLEVVVVLHILVMLCHLNVILNHPTDHHHHQCTGEALEEEEVRQEEVCPQGIQEDMDQVDRRHPAVLAPGTDRRVQDREDQEEEPPDHGRQDQVAPQDRFPQGGGPDPHAHHHKPPRNGSRLRLGRREPKDL